MTADALRERLVYWQRVLRLQDWDIEVRVLPQHHLNADSPMSTGRISFNHVYRSACILVADPATVIDDHTAAFTRHSVYDPEQTLVHELVHLLMPSPGEVKVDVEFTVEAVSKALVRLARESELRTLLHQPQTPIMTVPALDEEDRARWAQGFSQADPGPQA